MDVFVERLCEHCGVVRVGATGPFPAPYRYSVTYVIRDGFAEPVGFDHQKATPREFHAVIASINRATGKLVAYTRAGNPELRIVQIDPSTTKGKIVMHRKPKHVAHAINTTTGKTMEDLVADELEQQVIPLLRRKRIILRNPSQVELEDGWQRISFERRFLGVGPNNEGREGGPSAEIAEEPDTDPN